MSKVNDAWTVVKDCLLKIESVMNNLSTKEKEEVDALAVEWIDSNTL